MELYLDSVDLNEIRAGFELGFLTGLTTTPTFMHRHGVTDIDGMILQLQKMVPILQVEALGRKADDIYAEAHRLLDIGVDPQKTVFKIPVSWDGVKVCKTLVNEGLMVNVHLVYTLQQAYMALEAGATYVCPLVGRLQDQGHDALALVEQCVDCVERYGYLGKIMFSSVRNAEHVRNAVNIGVHTVTVPYKILKQLTENNFTTIGTEQFFEHTHLMTVKVRDVIRPINPLVTADTNLTETIVKMTEFGFGGVTVVDKNNKLLGAFTDGDLRRLIQTDGRDALKKTLADMQYKEPITVNADALLNEAHQTFCKSHVDTLIVMENDKPIGILDIQDLNENT
ncbi:MAG: CBS domain-containing protein [Gammaproteobacteria bacterium]|nr:CBS domain-containing protein [Gammaproteobacteria bacterium]